MDTVEHEVYRQNTKNAKDHRLRSTYHDIEHESLFESIEMAVAKYKAFTAGIAEGFYDEPDALFDSECLNIDAIDAIYNLFEGFEHGNGIFDKTFKVVTALYVFQNNLTANCKASAFMYDTLTYCFRSS